MSDTKPDYLIPRMGDRPVSSARHYDTATLTRILGKQSSLTPIRVPVSVPSQQEVSAGMPAEGVLLMHQQSWVIEGTALGPLAHSVCLAPGEITQIAIRNRTRSVMENSVDVGVQSESATATGSSSTAKREAEQARVRSTASGSTQQSSDSASAEGHAGFIVSGSGGTNLTRSRQANTNLGNRQVSEQANQAVHQQANDQAARARARTTVSVQEVSESDSLEIKTRVLANYNHMHALTMQYFEVEQVYQLQTRVIDAERLLFVPLKSIDFSDQSQRDNAITRYRDHMIGAAQDLGLEHVAARLDAGRFSGTEPDQQIVDLNNRIKSLTEPPADASSSVESVSTIAAAHARLNEERELFDIAEDEVLEARDEMRNLGVNNASSSDNDRAQQTSLAARGKAQRRLRTSTAHLRSMTDRVSDAQLHVQALTDELERLRYSKAQTELAVNLDDKALAEVLLANELAINQGIWLRLDSSETSALLQQLTMNGDRLGDTVDPAPVAVAGNRLAFRWRFRDNDEGRAASDRFKARFVGDRQLLHSVSVPTGGVFGEAVLGESNAAEKIDLSRFWNWTDSLPPIRPAEIAALGVTDEPSLRAPTPVTMPKPTLNFNDVVFPDSESRLASVSKTLSDPDVFRDLSGQEATAALARSSLELSAQGASKAGEIAGKNYRRFLKFQQSIGESVLGMGAGKNMNTTMTGGAINAKTKGQGSSGGLHPASAVKPAPAISFTPGKK